MSRPPTAPPLTDGEFADLMAACGPFEEAPHIAVAVSGGADSLALAFLAADWAAAQGGRVTALTVDHKLRRESTTEAQQVAAWLTASGMDHAILDCGAEKPGRNVMAAARDARYTLSNDWCRRHGVLHLLTAHHMEDQAATFLLRLKRGSGLHGLAAMPKVREGFPRLLRPLLDVPRLRLANYLAAHNHGWIEDPTNQNTAYDRNRTDHFLAENNPLGLAAHRVAAAVTGLERAKAALDRDIADALARSVAVSPLGTAALDPGAFGRQPEEIQLRVLSRVLLTVGGNAYPPRLERLARLRRAILDGTLGNGRTLSGCRIREQEERISFRRETAAIPDAIPVTGPRVSWDNRFQIDMMEAFDTRRVWIGRITVAHWRQLKFLAPAVKEVPIPAAARWTLPVLWDDVRLLAAPHFDYTAPDVRTPRIAFRPRHALT